MEQKPEVLVTLVQRTMEQFDDPFEGWDWLRRLAGQPASVGHRQLRNRGLNIGRQTWHQVKMFF